MPTDTKQAEQKGTWKKLTNLPLLIQIIIMLLLLSLVIIYVHQKNFGGGTTGTLTPSVKPTPTDTQAYNPNTGLVTFTSPSLGITFMYPRRDFMDGQTTYTATRSGNTITVASGQYVQVFTKSTNTSLQEAIAQQLFQGCNSDNLVFETNLHVFSASMAPVNASTLTVSTKSTAAACNNQYDESDVRSYFRMDNIHQDTFIFVNSGQYGIYTKIDASQVWDETIGILK